MTENEGKPRAEGGLGRLGRYRLLKRIAVGEMSTVHLAVHGESDGLRRVVVVKALREEVGAEEEVRQMFLDEARIAARMKHPHIVHLYDVGEADDRPFLAMEYVFGSTLDDIARRLRKYNRQVSIPFAVKVLCDALAALHHAYSLGERVGQPLQVIHRDISPDNILVAFEGVAKLMDFGIARARVRVSKTRRGVLKGKYAYMSPEQVRNREIDHRSDQFSLAVVFYEIVTGTRLFERENEFTTMRAVEACQVPPVGALRRDAPQHLTEVLHRALSHDAKDRFPSHRDMQAELARLLEGGSVERTELVADVMTGLFENELERRKQRISQAEDEEERELLLGSGFELIQDDITESYPTRPAPLAEERYKQVKAAQRHIETDPAGAMPFDTQESPLSPSLDASRDDTDEVADFSDAASTAPELPPTEDDETPSDDEEETQVYKFGSDASQTVRQKVGPGAGPWNRITELLRRRNVWIYVFAFFVFITIILLALPEEKPAERPEPSPEPLVTRRPLGERFFQEGQARMQQKDFAGALAAFAYAEAAEPKLHCEEHRGTARRELRYVQQLTQAREAFASKEYDQAWSYLATIPGDCVAAAEAGTFRVEVRKAYITHHLGKAGSYRDAGLLDQALKHVRTVLFEDENNAVARKISEEIASARTAQATGKQDVKPGTQAPKHKDVKTKKEKVKELLKQGVTQAKRGKFSQAITFFRKASRLDPKNCSAYLNTGAVYAKMGDARRAAEKYWRFLEVCPGHPQAPVVRKILQQYKALAE